MLSKGVSPPTDGKIVSRPRPISIVTLQASKSPSSKTPKSEELTHATPSGHDIATPVHTKTVSPIPFEMPTSSTQLAPSTSSTDKLSSLFENMYQQISGLERLIYSTNNQVQIRLTTIET